MIENLIPIRCEPDFVVEFIRPQLLFDFGLEEVFRPIHADLVDIDLGEASQLAKPRIGL